MIINNNNSPLQQELHPQHKSNLMYLHSKAVNRLHLFLYHNVDVKIGYKKLINKTKNFYLKEQFATYADQHQIFCNQLRREIEALNTEIIPEAKIYITAHQYWIDLKTLISSQHDQAYLEYAVALEDALLLEYKNLADDHTIPMSTRKLVSEQYESIDSIFDTIDLRQAFQN